MQPLFPSRQSSTVFPWQRSVDVKSAISLKYAIVAFGTPVGCSEDDNKYPKSEEHSRNEAQDHWERLVLTELGDTSKLVTDLTQSRHLNFHTRQSDAEAAGWDTPQVPSAVVFPGGMGSGMRHSPWSADKSGHGRLPARSN